MAEELDFHDELIRASTAEPFIPFAIITTSGASYKVKEPEFIICAGDNVTVFRRAGGSTLIRVYAIECIEFFDSSI